MVLGIYYLTVENPNATRGAGMQFFSYDDVLSAFEAGVVELHAKIKVRDDDGELMETTAGRIIFNKTIRAALAS
jgi:DNA-directed RNA polymerase subunit beta'